LKLVFWIEIQLWSKVHFDYVIIRLCEWSDCEVSKTQKRHYMGIPLM